MGGLFSRPFNEHFELSPSAIIMTPSVVVRYDPLQGQFMRQIVNETAGTLRPAQHFNSYFQALHDMYGMYSPKSSHL